MFSMLPSIVFFNCGHTLLLVTVDGRSLRSLVVYFHQFKCHVSLNRKPLEMDLIFGVVDMLWSSVLVYRHARLLLVLVALP